MNKNIKHGIQTVISDTSTTTLSDSESSSESSSESNTKEIASKDLKEKFLENVNKKGKEDEKTCFIKSILNSPGEFNLKYNFDDNISSSESEISSIEEFSLVK